MNMSRALSGLKNLLLRPIRWFLRLSRKKKAFVVVVLIVVLFVGIGIVSGLTAKPAFTTVRAEKSDIVEIVSETGKIATNGRTDIVSPANGIVTTVLVKNGDPVIVGQELLTIKSTATEQEKSAALANYLSAQSTLETARATLFSLQSDMFEKWDTFKTLAEGDDYEEANGTPKYNQRALPEFHIAEKDWLAAEASFKKQQSVISQAQAAVSSTYLLYQATQDATVKATAAGAVANLSVAPGNTVIAKLATNAPTPLLTIASRTATEVLVSLSETDIAKVGEGQEVTIDVSAVSDHTYQGMVKRVDTIGTDVAGVIRYHVYIEVTDADEKLRPGMTVDCDIITKKLEGVLSVPNAAVKPYQGGRAVRVLDGKTKGVKYVPVEVGVKGVEKTQIISGIDEGQEVITSLSNEQLRRPGLFSN